MSKWSTFFVTIGMAAIVFVIHADAVGIMNPAEGYVGSTNCQPCHRNTYTNWQSTLHSSIYRDPIPQNIISNFTGEVRLSKSSKGIPEVTIQLNNNGGAGPFTVTIQGQTFTVARAHGGRAIAENADPLSPNTAGRSLYIGKQRYHTIVNGIYYILPIQWNPIPNLDGNKSGWVEYNLEDWFDTNGVLALNPAQNEERRCSGCHQTGVQVTYDQGRGQWIHGAIEENIGCESCHGPGEAHINSPSKATMFNPATDATDIDRKNDICGQCHSRGKSVEIFNGKTVEFPYKDGRGFRPGDNVWDLYIDGGGYWGDGVSRQHHQQSADYAKSKHSTVMTCWSCHNPHGSSNEHDLTKTARDNSLCGQCHPTILASIETHSNHPAANPQSPRCVDCHMNAMQNSAVDYDIHQHTFDVTPPAHTLAYSQPNACAICHRQYQGIVDSNISVWNEPSDLAVSGWLDTVFQALFINSNVNEWTEYER